MSIKYFSYIFLSLFLISCGGGGTSDTAAPSTTKVNSIPIANAGEDQTVSESIIVTLDASNSKDDDGSIVSYQWSQISGTTIEMNNSNEKVAHFETPVSIQSYSLMFLLTIEDNDGATKTDEVSIHVNHENLSPRIDIITASPDELFDNVLTVNEGNFVKLNAIASDLDGEIISYNWVQQSGQTVELMGEDTPELSFNTPEVNKSETLSFQLKVTDNDDDNTISEIDVVVTPSIVGKVVDDPLKNAEIQLIDLISGEVLSSVISDANGSYQLTFPDTETGFLIKSSGGVLNGQAFTGEMYALCLNVERKVCHVTPLTTLIKHYTDAIGSDITSKAEVVLSLNQLLNIDIENDPFISGNIDGSVDVDEIRVALDGGAGLHDWIDEIVTYLQGNANTTPEDFFGGVNDALRAHAGDDQTVIEQSEVNLQGQASGTEDLSLSYQWVQLTGPSVVLLGENTSSLNFDAPTVTDQKALQFRLSVTTPEGVAAYDSVIVNVDPINETPVTNAGINQSVYEQESVTLAGQGADSDGNITSVLWMQDAGTGVTLIDADKLTASFTAPSLIQTETLTFTLTLTDNEGASDSDSVDVIVAPSGSNQAPTVDAGDDQTVDEQNEVHLIGSASDGDGNISNYLWTQKSGMSVFLENDDTASATFTAPTLTESQLLEFQLVATDNEGESNSDEIIVTINPVNNLPVVQAGDNQSVFNNTTVFLDGQATDTDGTVDVYAWSQISGPRVIFVEDAEMLTANFVAPEVSESESYTFSITAWDNEGGSNSDSLDITINPQTNAAPIANAGVDQSVKEESNVSLSGTGSDSDGTIVSYHWDQIVGSQNIVITNSDEATAYFVAPTLSNPETYSFRLTVLDDKGAGGVDTVDIVISPKTNVPPVANGGGNQTIIEGGTVTLDGSGSTDSDGTINAYLWEVVADLDSGGVVINDADKAVANFIAPSVDGRESAIVKLTVWDNDGSSDTTNFIYIYVEDESNSPPTADGGGNQTVDGGVTVYLDGTGSSDADGTISSYNWGLVSGNGITINNASNAIANFVAPYSNVEQTVKVRLMVYDDLGDSDNITVNITVNPTVAPPPPEDPNVPPVADAGSDKSVNELTTVNLYGNGSSDSDGTVTRYLWGQLAGPTVEVSNINYINTSFVAPDVSESVDISFRLIVWDNDGDSDDDTVTITINPVP